MITQATHFIKHLPERGGWVVIARRPQGLTIVSKPTTANKADDQAVLYNKSTARGQLLFYPMLDKLN